MFLGLPDPSLFCTDPVLDLDPDPDPSIKKQKSKKNTLISTLFRDFFLLPP
jgi:hypothetical protein